MKIKNVCNAGDRKSVRLVRVMDVLIVVIRGYVRNAMGQEKDVVAGGYRNKCDRTILPMSPVYQGFFLDLVL